MLPVTRLPDCAAEASFPNGVWDWTDPTTGTPARVDPSGRWQDGQLIAPPESPAHQPGWLASLQAWRQACVGPLGLDNKTTSILDRSPDLAWTQSAFVHVQMHPFDSFFYDREAGRYTVARWLDDLRARFGGVDAALIWPTYPMLGIDDRNAYDMIRDMPGAEAPGGSFGHLRPLVRELHEAGVRVLWPLMPWDTATRHEGPEPRSMVAAVLATGADGVNGDTLYVRRQGGSNHSWARAAAGRQRGPRVRSRCRRCKAAS